MKSRYFLYLFTLALVSSSFTSCSTTKHISEDDPLYIGVDEIAYNGYKKKDKKVNTSVGVIKSISDAAESVQQALQGKTMARQDTAILLSATASKAERKAAKAAKEQAKQEWEATKTEVEAVLSYPPNHALLGSNSIRSPFKFGLWLYNAFAADSSSFGKWMLRTFATDPVLISTVSPEVRSKVAQNTLRNNGYFHAKVDYDVRTQKNPRKSKIAYNVNPNLLWRYDSIVYRRFPTEQDSLVRASLTATHLHKGSAFSASSLQKERLRLSNLFRENGYYFHSPAEITLRADTFERYGYVQMQIQPTAKPNALANRPWHIGKTYVNIYRNATDTLTQSATRQGLEIAFSGKRPALRPYMWRHASFLRRGDRYSLSRERTTVEKINEIGVLSHLDVTLAPRDTLSTTDTLDVHINAVMDKLYTASLELNATLKSNQQMGPGISFELAKLNAFHGGERVAFKGYGSYEWQTGAGAKGGNSLLNSYELGTQLSFEFPRFVFPFLSRKLFNFPAKTTFALDANWRNRAKFYEMVTGGFSTDFQWYKKRSLTHSLTPFSLEYTKVISTTATFDSILNQNPVLAVSMRNQFVPAIAYTLTYKSAAHHRNPVWVQLSLKEAGNLTNGIYALSGKKWSQKDKNFFANPFAQFIKATAEFHHKVNVRNRFTIASRLFAGAIFSYGNSTIPPYSEQFYVGGANSVRAFTVRSVGPGRFRSNNTKYAYLDQTGDIKVEANVELRFPIMGNLHGAVFLDAGNIWTTREDDLRPGSKFSFGKLKDLAVGTGAGLRYDLSFLVLRLDLGVALHAPYETSRRGWYNIPKFTDGLAFHFAIGYPF